MHLKAIPFKCKMCDVVCLQFVVEDCSIIIFCHLCVLVCDFIVHYSYCTLFVIYVSLMFCHHAMDPTTTTIDTHYK